MKGKLFVSALIKYLLGVLIVGALIFLPAGTLRFSAGWLFMMILFVPMFCAGIIMLIYNPALLESRLNAKEKQDEQKKVVGLSALMFVAGFVLAGLNFRFGWIVLPSTVNFIAAIVFIIGYLMYAEVLRENAYLSRTVEVRENQRVVDTGLYGIVRHPMYASTVLLFLSMPLVLGSFISFLIFLVYPFLIARRIENEEEVLERELKGYTEYKKKVKYKMIPFVW